MKEEKVSSDETTIPLLSDGRIREMFMLSQQFTVIKLKMFNAAVKKSLYPNL